MFLRVPSLAISSAFPAGYLASSPGNYLYATFRWRNQGVFLLAVPILGRVGELLPFLS